MTGDLSKTPNPSWKVGGLKTGFSIDCNASQKKNEIRASFKRY